MKIHTRLLFSALCKGREITGKFSSPSRRPLPRVLSGAKERWTALSRTLFFVCWLCGSFNASAADKPPNIVVILADDFGVGDIQAHYPENMIATPYLDKLVGQGMSFTDAHSPSAVCSPTRYGLLTGRYSWRTRMQEWVIAAYEPPLISPDILTLPQFLRDNGYATACFGKWHLGWDWVGPQQPTMHPLLRNFQKDLSWDFTQPIGGGPTARGFDYYFGVVLPNMPPFCWIENNRVTVQPAEKYRYEPQEGFVVMPQGFEGSPMAPGWRFENILPELTKRAVAYIHQRADQDQPFFLYFPQTSPHEPVVPSERFLGKSGIAPIANFVMETDWSTGQVLQAIDNAGLTDNTIVIFTADNGHSHYTGWDELVAAGHAPSGPYRGHKGDVWEGGHRVPLVVRWPDHIGPGTSSDQLVCLTDLFATCAEVLDKELPRECAQDSFSFLAAATGQEGAVPERTTMINHSNFGEFAYRSDDWKLVYKLGDRNLEASRGKPTVAELYNLANDVAEAKNLATELPDRLKMLTLELASQIDSGASRPGAIGTNDCTVRYDQTQQFRWVED
ncbi:MAG: arylsulfatase [Planctomycetales bacterium]|nr:arylsulfatase [Planctomycetales bacterium]